MEGFGRNGPVRDLADQQIQGEGTRLLDDFLAGSKLNSPDRIAVMQIIDYLSAREKNPNANTAISFAQENAERKGSFLYKRFAGPLDWKEMRDFVETASEHDASFARLLMKQKLRLPETASGQEVLNKSFLLGEKMEAHPDSRGKGFLLLQMARRLFKET